MKTVNADTQVVDNVPASLTPIPSQSTIPSIINIPPQISTTAVWVGLGFVAGFALCIWLTKPKRRNIID